MKDFVILGYLPEVQKRGKPYKTLGKWVILHIPYDHPWRADQPAPDPEAGRSCATK